MTRKYYIILNIVFIVLFSGVFIYSYFVTLIGEHITCVHQKYFGTSCPSCGMTRSFSALLHFDAETAIELNRVGFQIFIFFATQLFLRIIFFLAVTFKARFFRVLCKTDLIISPVLFLICFYPLIFSTFLIMGSILSG